ncbi:unnamed protein product [Rhizoctonia solani]|uniref:DUF7770 domain-containing protein n=1 Tax=Rhizoctonia solani TaxID=456999 RepID=A0A8H3DLY7_9AGAM|nr:unnamed protein product [Rhizoctonia solani]
MSSTTIFDKQFHKPDRNCSVQQVILSGSPVNIEDPNTVLHWHIILRISETQSVLLDMPPAGVDGRTGILFIQSAAESTAAEIDISAPIVGEVTVGAIIDLLLRLNRDKYRYDDSGSGCRFWCIVVLGDMEKQGYVASGTVAKFNKQIEGRSQVQPSLYPWPTREGVFYVSKLPSSSHIY